jgi:hypothetical protein
VIAEVRLCYFEKNILTATRTSRMLKIFLRVLSGIDKANFDENQLPAIKATAIISTYSLMLGKTHYKNHGRDHYYSATQTEKTTQDACDKTYQNKHQEAIDIHNTG